MYLHLGIESPITQTFGLLSNSGTNVIEEYLEYARSAVGKNSYYL